MGVIAIQDNIDGSELSSVSGCGKLRDILPDFDFTHAIILKNGERLTPDYKLGEDEVIYIRKTPGAAEAAATYLGYAIVTAIIGAIGYKLIDSYINKKNQEEQEKAQKRAKDLAQQIDQLPFIKGAKNKSALGNGVQYVIGSVRNVPYMLTDGFYSLGGTDGDKLFYNAILSLGYGTQKVKKIFCGDELLIENANGISGGVHSVRSASLYYDAENSIELRQPGAAFTSPQFKQKVVAVTDGSEIKHDFDGESEPLFRTCPDYTQKVELVIEFNGLRKYESDAWTSHSVTVTPSWSNDDGVTWHSFTFDGGSNTFTRNSKKTLRFKATKTFTASECYGKKIKIKLERSVKLESNSNEDCYLLYMQSYCYDNKASSASALVSCALVSDFLEDKTTRLGIRLIANDNTKDVLDEFACEVSGAARTWSGSAWSTQKSETRNPAAWALEVLTSDKHAHSQYDDTEIDLDSFGEWYELCEDEGFCSDTVITDGRPKKDLLDALCSISGATIYTSPLTGKLTAAVDKKEETPVALFNSQDVLSMSYDKSLERRLDGVKVTFTNRDNWSVDTRDVMLDGGERSDDDKLGELAPEFVTNADHAYKLAQRQLRAQELQPRTLTVRCGGDGEFYPLYSRVKVQFSELKQGIRSSVIKEVGYVGVQIAQFILADYVDFVPGVRYGVIIQAVTDEGRALYTAEVTGAGRTRTVSLREYITPGDVEIVAGNVLSFGELTDDGEFVTVAHDFKIYGIAPDGEGAYTLTLKDYNDALYEYGTIPPYKSNITHAARLSQKTISDMRNAALDAGVNALEQAKREIKQIRTLASLEDEGTAGDWGSYRNRLYQYINGAWTPAAAPGYLGAYSSGVPELTEGNYFLAVATFPSNECVVSDGEYDFAIGEYTLGSRGVFNGGTVYVALSDSWVELTDRADYRYLLASPDMEFYGFALPEAAALAVSGAESHYVATVQTIAGLSATTGSLVVYNGNEAGFVKGDVYKKTPTGWEHLDPADQKAEGDYQKCFSAISAVASDISGAYVNLYAQKIVSLEATIRALATKVITLLNGGLIKSSTYNGTIDPQSGCITGYGTRGICIDNEGNVDGVGCHFTDGIFEGLLDCSVMKVKRDDVETTVASFTAPTDVDDAYDYFLNLASGLPSSDTWTTKTITQWLGQNMFVSVNGVFRDTMRIRKNTTAYRYPSVEVQVLNGYIWQDILRVSGTRIIGRDIYAEFTLYNNYKQIYRVTGSTVLQYANLPTVDPHSAGYAWVDNGTMKISQG